MGAWRHDQQSNAQFWSSQPDPVMIERGQTEAIRLVQNTVNSTVAGSNAAQQVETTDANRTNMSGVPCMVFVDDEGFEEQFLMAVYKLPRNFMRYNI